MYRIVFEPTTARWLVQILSYHLFWRTVQTEDFKVFNQAQGFVRDVGLDQVYRNYYDTASHLINQGGHPAVVHARRTA